MTRPGDGILLRRGAPPKPDPADDPHVDVMEQPRWARIGQAAVYLSIWSLIVLVVGAQIGISHGRTLAGREHRSAVTAQSATTSLESAAPSPLRCFQSPSGELRAWTQAEAEAQVRAAVEFLETAEGYHVPALKQAWATQAQATLLLIQVCTSQTTR